MQKKSKKKWPWAVLGIILALIAAPLILLNGMRGRSAQTFYSTYTVSPGSVEVSVTGSGMLAPADTENINLPDGIKIDDVLVQAGDIVHAGQVLAALNPDSLRNQAASLYDELASLDNQLTQMDGSKTTEYVYAPVKGRIKYLPVVVDDGVTSSIAKHGSLAVLSTDGQMRVEILTDTEFEMYSEVVVKWNDEEKKGDITGKIANGYVITLTDNGTPYGETASVYHGDTLIGSGILQINKPIAVYANGGTIAKIHYKENASVTANAKLFTLDNEPQSNKYQQTFSKRQELAEQLQTIIQFIDDPFVVATSKGTIREVLVSDSNAAGALVNSGNAANTGGAAGKTTSTNGKSTAFVIAIDGALIMTIAVDELDIGSIILDQSARVTLDAISSETFEAAVTRISYLGTANGNITTYAVELMLEKDERFLSGMNGNATIMVDRANNVLLVPIEAINEDETGIYVYVSESGLADGSDRQRRDITTGLSDGEYAEITSGLSKGDIILYAKAASIEPRFPGRPNGMPGGFSRRGTGDAGGDRNVD